MNKAFDASLPMLSVVLPVHNGGEVFPKTVKQILRQDYPNFELILAENGSTDQTWEICRVFAASDPRVKAIQSEPGTTLARKAGVLLAEGEWITFADHDDGYINTRALSGMMQTVLRENADIVQFNHYAMRGVFRNKVGVKRSFTVHREKLLRSTIAGVLGAYGGKLGCDVWDKVFRAEPLKQAVSRIHVSLTQGTDMLQNAYAFLQEGVDTVHICRDAYYCYTVGVGVSGKREAGEKLFEAYRVIKPTIMTLAYEADVGSMPIFRSNLETLNFLNGLIKDSVLRGDPKEETLRRLREYASWDFVRLAAYCVQSVPANETKWIARIKTRAALDDPEAYYDRIVAELGILPLARLLYRCKLLAKQIAVRLSRRR